MPVAASEGPAPVAGAEGSAYLDASAVETTERLAWIKHTIAHFRDTTVLVPVERGKGFLTADFGGVRWIHAFTSAANLTRYDQLQGHLRDRRDYVSVLGWRLLDVVVPEMGMPCGVALDVGSDENGVLLPPVVGIVPDTVAVDAEVNRNGAKPW